MQWQCTAARLVSISFQRWAAQRRQGVVTTTGLGVRMTLRLGYRLLEVPIGRDGAVCFQRQYSNSPWRVDVFRIATEERGRVRWAAFVLLVAFIQVPDVQQQKCQT
ncbi:hypothetical protein CC86DRAFT_197967 [Ophiobolus disseminans]|uniref:Uncharacterized protein n=1 Tax=Ophiobolus disseminans TaxID=1469910 RepID=A0A6A7A6H6_9PLEO|nr:hypothetical protein CC86DRAFT_197967 [Ophiobolus disseminans]